MQTLVLSGKTTEQGGPGLGIPAEAQGADPLGFIGAEGAFTAQTVGVEATVVCSAAVPLSPPFGRELAADIAALHGINRAELICDASIEPCYSGGGLVSGLRLPDGRYLPAGVVLMAVGAMPNKIGLPGPASNCAMASSVIRWASGHFTGHDRAEFAAGGPAAHSFLAVYYSIGRMIVSDLPTPTSVTAEEQQNDHRSLHAELDSHVAGVHVCGRGGFPG
jgi:hypothetical protein